MSVMERVKYFAPALKQLIKASREERKKLFKEPCLVRLLSEYGFNILKGNIRLSKAQYKSLKPYKRLLLFLSKPKHSIGAKKKALIQKGFPVTVISTLLTSLAKVAGEKLILKPC